MLGALTNNTLLQMVMYQLIGALVGPIVQPYSQSVLNAIWPTNPVVPLTPEQLAEAVVRGELDEGQAAAQALLSGTNAERFHTIYKLAGDAPGPMDLATALRRGLIDQATYETGIRQSRLRTEWSDMVRQLVGSAPGPDVLAVALRRGLISQAQYERGIRFGSMRDEYGPVIRELINSAPPPEVMAVALRRGIITSAEYQAALEQGTLDPRWADTIRALAIEQPSPIEPLEALLEGQISRPQAEALYAQFGGDPANFQWRFDSRGSAPTPLEAADMARRGIIGWTGQGANVVSFEQAFLEGPWRNKWQQPYREAAAYLPPPRTIVAMLRAGSLTRDVGAKLLAQVGLSQELIKAYLDDATQQKTQSTKDLSQSMVVDLYADRLVTHDVAATMLGSLGYDAQEADFVLSVQDARLGQRFLSTALGRVHALYTSHKITRAQAVAGLAQLGVDATGQSDLLGLWDWERDANVRQISPAEYAQAFHESIMSQDEAQAALVELGYTAYDAWLYLSIHEKKALPGQPARGAIASTPPA